VSILGRATFSSYVESMKKDYERWGYEPFSYDLFRVAWRKFAENITFNEKEDFSCGECGEEPEIVLFDGTFLSCRKDLLSFAETAQPLLPPPSIFHSDRVFLTAAKGKLLEEFAVSCQEKPIEREKVSQLLEIPRLSALSTFFQSISIPAEDQPVLSFLFFFFLFRFEK